MSEASKSKAPAWAITVLLTLLTSLSFWTLRQTHDNTVLLRAVTQKVDDGKESRLSAQNENKAEHAKISRDIEQLVSRREFDLRIAELKTELTRLQIDLSNIAIRLSVLESKVPTK